MLRAPCSLFTGDAARGNVVSCHTWKNQSPPSTDGCYCFNRIVSIMVHSPVVFCTPKTTQASALSVLCSMQHVKLIRFSVFPVPESGGGASHGGVT